MRVIKPIEEHTIPRDRVEFLFECLKSPNQCDTDLEDLVSELLSHNAISQSSQKEHAVLSLEIVKRVSKSLLELNHSPNTPKPVLKEDLQELSPRGSVQEECSPNKWIEVLVRCFLRALPDLRSYNHLLCISKLDGEKACCNIAAKLVDLGKFSLSLNLIKNIYQSLWPGTNEEVGFYHRIKRRRTNHHKETGMESPQENKIDYESINPGPESYDESLIASQGGQNPNDNRFENDNIVEADLLTLPKTAKSDYNGDNLLIGIVCICIVIKILLKRKNFISAEKLVSLICENELGLESVFNRLFDIPYSRESLKTHSTNIFKLLYSGSQKLSKHGSLSLLLRELSLKYLARSAIFSPTIYQEQIVSAIKAYRAAEDLPSENKDNRICEFYSNAFETLSQSHKLELNEVNCEWIMDCISSCISSNDMQLLNHIKKFAMEFITPHSKIENGLNINVNESFPLLLKNIEIWLALMSEPEESHMRKEIIKSLKHNRLSSASFSFSKKDRISESFLSCIGLICKALPFISRSKRKTEFDTEVFDSLFELMKRCISFDEKNEYTIRIMIIMTEYANLLSECHVRGVESNFTARGMAKIIDPLEFSLSIAKNNSLPKCYFLVAESAYIIGQKLQNIGTPSLFSDYLEKLCHQFRDICANYRLSEQYMLIVVGIYSICAAYVLKNHNEKYSNDIILRFLSTTIGAHTTYKEFKSTIISIKRFIGQIVRSQFSARGLKEEMYIVILRLIQTLSPNAALEDIFIFGEMELSSLKRLQTFVNTSKYQLEIVDILLHLVSPRTNPISYSRLLVEKCLILRTLESIKKSDVQEGEISKAEHCLTEALLILEAEDKNKPFDSIAHELGYDRKCLVAEAYTLKGIIQNENGRYDSYPFLLAMKSWAEYLESTNSSSIAPRPRDMLYSAPKNSYMRLKTLADYFEMLYQPQNKIICLRIAIRILPLCNIESERDNDTRKCIALVDIGHSYLSLGYNEEANNNLMSAKVLVMRKSCHEFADMYWYISYAYYLANIGEIEEARIIFSKSKMCLSNNDNLKSETIEDLIPYMGQYLHSYAFLVKSIISLFSGNIVNAIQQAETSFELFVKAYLPTIPESDSFFANKQDTDSSKHNRKYKQFSLSKLGTTTTRLKMWSFSARLMTLYHWLGTTYMYRGSSTEAEYYYKQGLDLAHLSHSSILNSHFLLSLAEVDFKKNSLEVSENLIEDSNKCLSKVVNVDDIPTLHLVNLNLCVGGQKLRVKKIKAAIEAYKEAESLVRKCISENSIYLVNKRFEKTFNKISTELLSLWQTNATDEKFYLLHYAMVYTASQLSYALTKQQKVTDAELALITAESFHQRQIERSVYYGAMAKVKMIKVLQQLEKSSRHAAFFDSGFSLPLLCFNKSEQVGKVPGKSAERAALLSKLCGFFKKAFRLVYLYGPAPLIHEIAHSISLLYMMESYLPGRALRGVTVQFSTEMGFYLEISKAYTLKNETISIVKEKIQKEEDEPSKNPDFYAGIQNRNLKTIQSYYKKEAEFDTKVYDFIKQRLPENWTVCSISVDTERGDLYISRYLRGQDPLILRLPMNRGVLRGNSDTKPLYLDGVISTFNSLLEENKKTMSSAKLCNTDELKMFWWQKRKNINDVLRHLLGTVERHWLGAFKGIFLKFDLSGNRAKLLLTFKQKLESIMQQYIDLTTLGGSSKDICIAPEFCQMILNLGSSPSYEEIEDVIYFIIDSFLFSGADIKYDEMCMDKIFGSITEIVKGFHNEATEISNNVISNHTILILDRNLQFFPWENLPILRNRPTCRLPTLSFLRDQLIRLETLKPDSDGNIYPEVDPSSNFYLLNPGSDLVNTQNTFQEYLQVNKQWNGYSNKIVDESELIKNLEQKDIFMYFGHGGGEKYIRGHKIKAARRFPVSLLLGCSSGSLHLQGEFDPKGTPLNYLIAGSKAILANLWDVTDRDIDRFSTRTFEEWQLGDTSFIKKQPGLPPREFGNNVRGKRISLSEAVARSKDSCILSYLTGAAPVVYGIPVYLKEAPE